MASHATGQQRLFLRRRDSDVNFKDIDTWMHGIQESQPILHSIVCSIACIIVVKVTKLCKGECSLEITLHNRLFIII